MIRKISLFAVALMLTVFCQAQIIQHPIQIQAGNNLNAQQERLLDSLFQYQNEITFSFKAASKAQVDTLLTNIVSIDGFNSTTLKGLAVASKNEFRNFLALNLQYSIIPPEGPKVINMATTMLQMASWNRYPTYQVYDSMMTRFQTNYPNLCKRYSLVTLASGRKLIIMKITNNVSTKACKPQFLYTSTIHGDEVTGYIMMLHLIDYLLSNYGTNTRVTNMLNNIEIWILPDSNPDGTYHGGNTTLTGAQRYNASNVDMNRNYADPRSGQHPDGNAYQTETQTLMNLADSMYFVMSANFHGGSDVVNFPWDTWTSSSRTTADDAWWRYVSTNFADSAQVNGSTTIKENQATNRYFKETYSSGISEGGDWYVITGGRQDYMNYFKHCREVTVEISIVKKLDSDSLPIYWNVLKNPLLKHIEACLNGIRGVITDSCSGNPIRAKVFVNSHDVDSSWVYSAPTFGNYYRPIKAGTWSLTFSAAGYTSKTITNVVATDGNATILNVQLKPAVLPAANASIAVNPTGTICSGTSVTFTATPTNGGTTPLYQWKKNGAIITGANSSTYSTNTLSNGDAITCVVTSGLNCVTGSPSTSNSITMAVNSAATASVSIAANPSGTICSGTNVTFTANPVNGGTTPAYQWLKNGSIIPGATNPAYSTSLLANNDTITCRMTNNSACIVGSPAISNPLTMIVNTAVAASLTIAANPAGAICAGNSVTFSATTVHSGTSPLFQWKKNGAIIPGAIDSIYTSSTLANTDIITCEMTSNANCVTGSPAISNPITMVVNPGGVAGVSIIANPAGAICSGTTVTFTATPANGGTPSYIWTKNGTNIPGASASTYSSSSLANNDVIACVMTSSLTCATSSPATSNSITMTVNSALPAGNSITVSPGSSVCSGSSVTFTANATNGGTSPTYQWQLNGVNTGSNSSVYSTVPNDGDIVDCIITSSNSCAVGSPATSNTITMSIVSTLTVNVSIAALPSSTICAGTPLTFKATTVNGGVTPHYSWFVNGNAAGTDTTVFTASSLVSGDIVTCNLLSSESCAIGNPASSNAVTLTIHPSPATPVITQNGDSLFSNSITGNQWYFQNIVGGLPVSGASSQSYIPIISGDYFVIVTNTYGCVSDSSNIISVVITGLTENNVPEFSIYPNPGKGQFEIIFNNLQNATDIKIINTLGETIMQKQIKMQTQTSFDLSQFRSGMYFIKITSDTNSSIEKLILQK